MRALRGVVALVASVVLSVACCTGAHVRPAWNRVVVGDLTDPAVYPIAGRLYVTDQTSPLGRNPTLDDLLRIDRATGRVAARRRLGGLLVAAAPAGGDLWVVVDRGNGSALFALDPVTLRVVRRTPLASGDSLVAAGGALWVGGDGVLRRVDEATGLVTATVRVPGASAITLGGWGAVLVDGESTPDGAWRLQRRDAVTGALLVQTPVSLGVTAPSIGGVIDGGVWIAVATGMQGFAERLDLTTLRAEPGTVVRGTNGVRAEVSGGTLWVTQPAGAEVRNYCADPADGYEIAPLTVGIGDDDAILAVAGGEIYWTDEALRNATIYRAPVPAACRP